MKSGVSKVQTELYRTNSMGQQQRKGPQVWHVPTVETADSKMEFPEMKKISKVPLETKSEN